MDYVYREPGDEEAPKADAARPTPSSGGASQ